MNRKMTSIALVVGASLALAGCVGEPPLPGPAPEMAQTAALLNDQAQRVVTETFANVDAADKANDPTLLDDRVAGDALLVRTAQYKIAAATPDHAPDVLPAEQQALYVSAAETWPRVLASVSAQPGDDLTPVVSLWLQDEIESPYSMRGWAHMIPGASMPTMASDTTGANQLALDDASVDPSPRAAIEEYVEFLRAGPTSELAANYTKDTYSERIFAARDQLTKAAQGAAGSYTDTIEADLVNTYVLQTADGGALVFAPISVTSAFTVTNAKVNVASADRALVEGTLANTVTHHFKDFVVMYIPGPALDSLPGLVAADHHLVKVTPS